MDQLLGPDEHNPHLTFSHLSKVEKLDITEPESDDLHG